MNTLTNLTDWETATATRGRGKGNEISSRYILGCDNWNWLIGLERKGKPVVGEKFFPCMRILFEHLVIGEHIKVDTLNCVKRIVQTLAQFTGITPPPVPELKTPSEYAAFGKVVDNTFDVSHGKSGEQAAVLRRVFKDKAEIVKED
jgi:hypothetical protein